MSCVIDDRSQKKGFSKVDVERCQKDALSNQKAKRRKVSFGHVYVLENMKREPQHPCNHSKEKATTKQKVTDDKYNREIKVLINR